MYKQDSKSYLLKLFYLSFFHIYCHIPLYVHLLLLLLNSQMKWIFLLVLIQCKSGRLTAAVNHNVSPLRYEFTTKPAGLLCTAVQLLIARKIRRSLPFTKQADVAMETVKHFKASANERPWVWLAWRSDCGENRPKTTTPCCSFWYCPYAVVELSILYYIAYKRYSITDFKNVCVYLSAHQLTKREKKNI